MKALYLIYSLTAQSLEHRGSKDLRFIPFFIIGLLFQPVMTSCLNIMVGDSVKVPIESVNANFYTRVSVWFYVALAITSLVVWLFFDRRRLDISGKFTCREDGLIFRIRYVIVLLSILFAVFLNYLSSQNSWLCLAVFSVALFITSLMIAAGDGSKKH